MKAIMVMYDSLNRHLLPNYGSDLVQMPNFRRLGEHTVTFDRSYVGSMPCMPARRELHTGRYNFLHRSWGPLEPFDDSMPEILKMNGIHTHLATDHYHYLEDGGATYHNRYSTWNCYRGQEGDFWKGSLTPQAPVQMLGLDKLTPGFRKFKVRGGSQDMINRSFIKNEEEFPQVQTFTDGLDFIERNHDCDNWFVQIETFDPHEPFFSPDHYQKMYFDPDLPKPVEDWPPYAPVDEPDEVVSAMRNKYFALASMCDAYLGKVLDMMDRLNLWEDTLLIVNTDHGFLLGEHSWWGKSVMPLYEEIAHTPLFIWDPRSKCCGERRQALVQTIDLAPTLLEFFGIAVPADMQGKELKEAISEDQPVRQYALFGYHGDSVNITDGRYVYYRAPIQTDGGEVFEYTLMPTHMSGMFQTAELSDLELAEPFGFTKNCRTLKIPVKNSYMKGISSRWGNLLFDLEIDPGQNDALNWPEKEAELLKVMRDLMTESNAPAEQYERLGL